MDRKFFLYFSEILGKAVQDEQGRYLGKINDIAMKMNGEIYPKANSLTVKRGLFKREFAKVAWEDVKEVADDHIKIAADPQKIFFSTECVECEFSLCRDILDQQIVDIYNRKVVRVNDLHLLRADNYLYLAHVDVGIRGLVRRLEWTEIIDWIVKMLAPHSPYLSREDLISWKSAQVLTLGRVKNVLRLDVARQKLTKIPPTELADIMEDLNVFEKKNFFKSLDVNLQRKVFTDLVTSQQAELIEELDEKEVVNLLENIPSDEAADLLSKIPPRKTRQLMKLLETKTSKKLSKLLKFSKNSAGGLMATEYLYLPQTAFVKDAMQKIKENTQHPGNIYYIYLVDEQHRLIGVTTVKNFINCDLEMPLIETKILNNIFVRTDDSIEKVALLLEKYKFNVIPVLNEENILQGVITIDDVMEELISLAWRKYKEKI